MIRTFVGPMGSGKTTRLIAAYQAARQQGRTCHVFVPRNDTRSGAALRSHDGTEVPAVPFHSAADAEVYLAGHVQNVSDLIVVDEVQFAHPEIASLLTWYADYAVVVGGLDMDYRGVEFETTRAVMRVSNAVDWLTSQCACGSPATHTHRKVPSTERIVVGGLDIYEPRCKSCFSPSPMSISASATAVR